MVTSYYIMNMSQRNELDLDDYYSSVFERTYRKSDVNKCRICLRDGSIPIHGNRETPGIAEALVAVASVEVSEEDEYPKHLCGVCYKFIRGAILFRKTAKLTDEILKKPAKLEKNDYNYNIETAVCDSPSAVNWDAVYAEMKPVEKVKNQQKVTCKICKKTVTTAYYKQHLTMHDPNHEKHVCEVCGKKFRLQCSYYNHRNVHRADFPYKCQFCPYRGRYSHLLNLHSRTHSGDYKYMCNECPARFLFKSNLNVHILKKHREPQHKCECKRAFHTSTAMRQHIEADHMGIKNHVCNICGKAFGYRNALMKHQRGVHKRQKLMSGRMPTYLKVEHEQKIKNMQSNLQLN